MTDAAITARGLTKRFGKVVALDALDLDVPRGAAVGLLGPAGAGKSTLIRLLAGLVRPSAGTLTLDGAPAGAVRSRRRLGVLLQDAQLYGWMTVREVLAFGADLAGMASQVMPARIDATAGHFQLEADLDRRVATLDGPTRGRLAVAQAFVGDPEILLLDEPALALDPDSRREVAGFLAALRGTTTVVIAARRFADVDALCDRVATLQGGRLALDAPIEDVRRRLPSIYVIQTASEEGLALAGLVARLRTERWVTDVSTAGGALRVVVTDDDRAARELVPAVVSSGAQVTAVRHEHGSLEQLAVKDAPA